MRLGHRSVCCLALQVRKIQKRDPTCFLTSVLVRRLQLPDQEGSCGYIEQTAKKNQQQLIP
jgi:hypothetical protein